MDTLYQFPFSHFCEKARWALDYKERPYTVKNLLPCLHTVTTRRLGPKTCVPILVTKYGPIQESAAIIDYLDRIAPAPLLTPRDPELARQARQWETYLDEEIGVTLRCWFYFYCLPKRELALKLMLRGLPWYAPSLYELIFPLVCKSIINNLQINSESANDAARRMGEAFMRINRQLEHGRFLVGGAFSRADLTACAHLAPLCLPNQDVFKMLPGPILNFRQMHVDQPFFRWMVGMYRKYRGNKPA